MDVELGYTNEPIHHDDKGDEKLKKDKKDKTKKDKKSSSNKNKEESRNDKEVPKKKDKEDKDKKDHKTKENESKEKTKDSKKDHKSSRRKSTREEKEPSKKDDKKKSKKHKEKSKKHKHSKDRTQTDDLDDSNTQTTLAFEESITITELGDNSTGSCNDGFSSNAEIGRGHDKSKNASFFRASAEDPSNDEDTAKKCEEDPAALLKDNEEYQMLLTQLSTLKKQKKQMQHTGPIRKERLLQKCQGRIEFAQKRREQYDALLMNQEINQGVVQNSITHTIDFLKKQIQQFKQANDTNKDIYKKKEKQFQKEMEKSNRLMQYQADNTTELNTITETLPQLHEKHVLLQQENNELEEERRELVSQIAEYSQKYETIASQRKEYQRVIIDILNNIHKKSNHHKIEKLYFQCQAIAKQCEQREQRLSAELEATMGTDIFNPKKYE